MYELVSVGYVCFNFVEVVLFQMHFLMWEVLLCLHQTHSGLECMGGGGGSLWSKLENNNFLADHLITKLTTGFDEASSHNITESMFLLPSANTNEASTLSIDSLLGLYEDDLPLSSAIDLKFDMCKQKWQSQTQLASELGTLNPKKKPYNIQVRFFPPYHPHTCTSWPHFLLLAVSVNDALSC